MESHTTEEDRGREPDGKPVAGASERLLPSSRSVSERETLKDDEDLACRRLRKGATAMEPRKTESKDNRLTRRSEEAEDGEEKEDDNRCPRAKMLRGEEPAEDEERR